MWERRTIHSVKNFVLFAQPIKTGGLIPEGYSEGHSRLFSARNVLRIARCHLPAASALGHRQWPHGITIQNDMTRRFSKPYMPAGGAPFSWAQWQALQDGFKASGWRSKERWQLAYLHSIRTLRDIARATLDGYAAISKPAAVSVQSVWIDGTPQVTGFLPDGRPLAGCELADLLFIVNQMSLSGVTVRRTGLLVQGKAAKRHNALPSNHSTKKERLLLEGLDRGRPLSVFRDIGLSSPIGKYTFGAGTGLKDCARYLMMAKSMYWDSGLRYSTILPLQIGWPKARMSSSIDPTMWFVEALQQLAINGGIGRIIQDKGPRLTCEWSRLVWDLLGDYNPIEMRGYGRQRRVNISPSVSFLAGYFSSFGVPPEGLPQLPEAFDRPPAISVVQVNIRSAGGGQDSFADDD